MKFYAIRKLSWSALLLASLSLLISSIAIMESSSIKKYTMRLVNDELARENLTAIKKYKFAMPLALSNVQKSEVEWALIKAQNNRKVKLQFFVYIFSKTFYNRGKRFIP